MRKLSNVLWSTEYFVLGCKISVGFGMSCAQVEELEEEKNNGDWQRRGRGEAVCCCLLRKLDETKEEARSMS